MTKVGLPFFRLVGEEGQPVLLCLCLVCNLSKPSAEGQWGGGEGGSVPSSVSVKILWPGTWDGESCSSGAGEATSSSVELFLCWLSLGADCIYPPAGANVGWVIFVVWLQLLFWRGVFCPSCFTIPWWPHLINSWKKEGDLCQVTSLTDRVFSGCTLRPLSGNSAACSHIFHQGR